MPPSGQKLELHLQVAVLLPDAIKAAPSAVADEEPAQTICDRVVEELGLLVHLSRDLRDMVRERLVHLPRVCHATARRQTGANGVRNASLRNGAPTPLKRRGTASRWPCRPLSAIRQTPSAVLLLEVLHERDESVNAFHRECVVDRGADAANAPVALERTHSKLLRL